MAKFKLTIKNAISGDLVTEVEFDEQIQAEAKNRFYDIFLEETAKLADGEYIGVLTRWMPSSKDWDEVGAPVISCEVSDNKSELTVQRIDFSHYTDTKCEEADEEMLERISRTLL